MRVRSTVAAIVFVAALVALAGCRPTGAVGAACVVTGDGFTRKDSCATMCVDWEITCPGAGTVTPDVCAGDLCGPGGACPAGLECVQIDSFADNSRCMPVSVCDAATPVGSSAAQQQQQMSPAEAGTIEAR